MAKRLYLYTFLYLFGAAIQAAPNINGNTLSWPDDGWYQVQRADTYETVCQGSVSAESGVSGGACTIGQGRYIVINHSTGERFENVVVNAPEAGRGTVTVEGKLISWPDDGWYQVQNAKTYQSVCEGGRSCEVDAGIYVVINHTTGERFTNIQVGAGDGGTSDRVVVNGNFISWPDNGWYQVQNADDYTSLCEGGKGCSVPAGRYIVINLTSGERYHVEVTGSGSTPIDTTTRVDFEIAVPAYQSNELQVRLAWGDKTLTAGWVGDEYWSASDDFPIGTGNPLLVTFLGRNGDIILGSVEVNYTTGTNASESYQVMADDFDTNRWDSDGDGVSNLDELIAGTDPLTEQNVKPELREPVLADEFWGPGPLTVLSRSSELYGLSIPADRPFFDNDEDVTTVVGEGGYYELEEHTVTIDIDESGTGTYSDTHRFQEPSNIHTTNQVATRTVTDDSVIWIGSFYELDSSAYRGIDLQFTTKTKKINETTRWQEGEVSREGIGLGPDRPESIITVSYALTGQMISDAGWCEPVAGTLAYDADYSAGEGVYPLVRYNTSISKAIDDGYWTVVDTTLTGELVEEYLVRDLGVSFYCDHADLD